MAGILGAEKSTKEEIEMAFAAWWGILNLVLTVALLAAVMFFWICGRQFVEEQVNLARTRPLGPWFYPLGKYLFCGVTLAVLILGSVMGGIG